MVCLNMGQSHHWSCSPFQWSYLWVPCHMFGQPVSHGCLYIPFHCIIYDPSLIPLCIYNIWYPIVCPWCGWETPKKVAFWLPIANGIIVSCLSNPVEPSMFDGESTRFWCLNRPFLLIITYFSWLNHLKPHPFDDKIRDKTEAIPRTLLWWQWHQLGIFTPGPSKWRKSPGMWGPIFAPRWGYDCTV